MNLIRVQCKCWHDSIGTLRRNTGSADAPMLQVYASNLCLDASTAKRSAKYVWTCLCKFGFTTLSALHLFCSCCLTHISNFKAKNKSSKNSSVVEGKKSRCRDAHRKRRWKPLSKRRKSRRYRDAAMLWCQIASLVEEGNHTGPSLVICPSALAIYLVFWSWC